MNMQSFTVDASIFSTGTVTLRIQLFIELAGSTRTNYLRSGFDDIIVRQITVENQPPNAPTITGQAKGKPGTEYEYKFVSTDPDGDNITYCIDWGDNTGEICIGPYPSSAEASAKHTWSEKDDYIIKAKARDLYGAESDWATLTVNMPKVKNVESVPFGFIFVFGLSVDVKIVQLEPGEDYVDLEVLNKPLYIWENEIITINSGAFVRLYEARGLFLPSFPICIGICSDWGIIG